MRKERGLLIAVAMFTFFAVPAQGGIITGTHGLNNLGAFTGQFNYQALTDASALINVTLTNTSPGGHGGYLTGFVFNNPNDRISIISLTSGPNNFVLLGGPSFDDSVNGSPFGRFDFGAALGGSFQGGGNPHGGLAVGQTGNFSFALTGQQLMTLTDADFRATLSVGPGDGAGHAAFVARFRGFDACPEDSDKAPLDPKINETPEPSTIVMGLLSAVCALGLVAFRRRLPKARTFTISCNGAIG